LVAWVGRDPHEARIGEGSAEGAARIHPPWALTLDVSGHVVALEALGAPPVLAIRTPLDPAARFETAVVGRTLQKPCNTIRTAP